ncbi:MAG: hypothetical protein ACOZDD_09520 [Bacteroidota bacterium]
MRKIFGFFVMYWLLVSAVGGQPSRISVHDPVMIREDGRYYLFANGIGWHGLPGVSRV